MKERLQKILSEAGVASRRASEELIKAGRVAVNGAAACLGMSADREVDEITVDGKPLSRRESLLYIALNKPKGYVTTMSDDRGRKTVTDLMRDVPTRVYPVGRLDMDTEGLLLLTNDGEFANIVAHPSFEKDKVYHVRVLGDVAAGVSVLRSSMDIDGCMITGAKARILSRFDGGGLIEVIIHQGRNRQVRKMCATAELKVLNLRRVSVGPVKLGNLPSGKWRHLTEEEIQALRSQTK